MKISKIFIPAFLLLASACGREEADLVSETYYDIAGVYRLESMKFKEPRAVDLNGDGISSEDILSEMNTFMIFEMNQNQVEAVVKGNSSGFGSDMAVINGSGKIKISMILQAYDEWSSDKVSIPFLYYSMDFSISPVGFLSVEPYVEGDVRGEVSFPMEDLMIFTINYGFYDFGTHSICNEESEWRFVRI